MDERISSVMVPPGYALDLYNEAFTDEKYTAIGKLREDEMGIACQVLPAQW